MARSIEVRLEVVISRSAAAVWAFVADLERLPEWIDEFRRVVRESDGPVGEGAVFRYTLRGERSATLRIEEWRPGRRLTWDGPPLRSYGGGARPRGFFEVEAIDAGHTRLVTCYRPQVSGSLALLAPVVKSWLRRQRAVDAARLRTLLEQAAAGAGGPPA